MTWAVNPSGDTDCKFGSRQLLGSEARPLTLFRQPYARYDVCDRIMQSGHLLPRNCLAYG